MKYVVEFVDLGEFVEIKGFYKDNPDDYAHFESIHVDDCIENAIYKDKNTYYMICDDELDAVESANRLGIFWRGYVHNLLS